LGADGGHVWPAAAAGRVPPAADRRVGPAEATGPSVGKGATVVDRVGHDVGALDDVLFDRETGRLKGLTLRVGGVLPTLLGGEPVIVLGEAVDRVAGGTVHLHVSREEVERVARAGGEPGAAE
jgi:hypothetical protein